MEINNLVPIGHLSQYYAIDLDFIHSLEQSGLIDFHVIEDEPFLPQEQLPVFTRILRFHFDLDINIEGIGVIIGLLDRIKAMQEELSIRR